jgi:catechol 2,3-dioxygenase-like lactoylglutathione lyase family enzyme
MNEDEQMRINTVILHVANIATLNRCRDWYRALGLPPGAPDVPDESYWFDVGRDVSLGVHIDGRSSFTAGSATIYLEVPDTDEAYERLKSEGFNFQGEPESQFWGRVAYLLDPAGNRVGLVTPSP